VELPPSRALGIARRADGDFDVAALDEVGGLAITRLDPGGQRIARVTFAASFSPGRPELGCPPTD